MLVTDPLSEMVVEVANALCGQDQPPEILLCKFHVYFAGSNDHSAVGSMCLLEPSGSGFKLYTIMLFDL